MRLIPALVLVCLLAACTGEQPGASDSEAASYTVDRDAAGTRIRTTGPDGEEVVIDAGGGSNASLPLGFTIYPGAAVVSNSTIATNDGEGSVLYMTTPDTPEAVIAHYRRQAEAAGISIAMEVTNNGGRTIAGEGVDGKNFMMTASATPAGTGVQLMIGQQPGG